jgi:hypothetical protein
MVFRIRFPPADAIRSSCSIKRSFGHWNKLSSSLPPTKSTGSPSYSQYQWFSDHGLRPCDGFSFPETAVGSNKERSMKGPTDHVRRPEQLRVGIHFMNTLPTPSTRKFQARKQSSLKSHQSQCQQMAIRTSFDVPLSEAARTRRATLTTDQAHHRRHVFSLFQDDARAAWWWLQAGPGSEIHHQIGLAESSFRMGNTDMAKSSARSKRSIRTSIL